MRESGYYPPGAEFDPNAPWNEKEKPQKEFNVCARQTLIKHGKVLTTDYEEETCDVDGHVYTYTDETDWAEAWAQSNKSVSELISALKMICDTLIGDYGHVFKTEFLRELSEECEGWMADTDCDEYEEE